MKKTSGLLLSLFVLCGGSTLYAQQTAGAYATRFGQFVVEVTVTNGGSGYTNPPQVIILGGGGSGAGAYSVLTNDGVSEIIVTNAGGGYTSDPQVIIASPRSTPFASSVVLDLPIDGSVIDLGPSHLTVTTNGGTFVTNRFGDTASGFQLNGINQNIAIPYNAALYPTEMTLSAWVKFTASGIGIWRAGNAFADSWRGFNFRFAGPNTFAYHDYTGTTYNAQLQPTNQLVFHRWYHVVMSRTTNSATLFINGVIAASQTGLTPYAKPQSVPMSLGSDNNNTFFDYSPLVFDSVHIYNRALSGQEVQTLFFEEGGVEVPSSITIATRLYVRVGMNVNVGFNYQLESSSNMLDWVYEGSAFTATNTPTYRDIPAEEAQQYFRLLSLP